MAKGFEIQNGKDWMQQAEIERLRRLRGGTGQLTRGELEQNCAKLVTLLNERVPLDVGFAVVVFPRDSAELGVTGANVENLELVEKVLEKAAKRVHKKRTGGAA